MARRTRIKVLNLIVQSSMFEQVLCGWFEHSAENPRCFSPEIVLWKPAGDPTNHLMTSQGNEWHEEWIQDERLLESSEFKSHMCFETIEPYGVVQRRETERDETDRRVR